MIDQDKVWPVDISLAPNKAILTVRFDDGRTFALDAELLRVESPSAEVQGHGADQKITPAGKQHVTIRGIEPVGHYAIKIIFSDGHDSGLFTWKTLYDYGLNAETLKSDYLARLEVAGLSRS
jgi:DUF971 family protein